jgi:hypothetical protein
MPPIAAIMTRTMAIFLELPDSAELIEDIADEAADDADDAADDAADDDDDSTIMYNYCVDIL